MGKIMLEGMVFYAYHGCFDEEQIIGNHFLVDLSFEYNTDHAEHTDKLSGTVDYQEIYKVIAGEMHIKSKLLEHLGRRIVDAVKFKFAGVKKIRLKISKCHPPIGGKMDKVSFIIEEKA